MLWFWCEREVCCAISKMETELWNTLVEWVFPVLARKHVASKISLNCVISLCICVIVKHLTWEKLNLGTNRIIFTNEVLNIYILSEMPGKYFLVTRLEVTKIEKVEKIFLFKIINNWREKWENKRVRNKIRESFHFVSSLKFWGGEWKFLV